ncbi:MAG: hypothetical protein ACKVZ6_19010, partial [Kineosporiaceae bacterium]
MATNLLLEGDDLEALLLRAASEGGANARILRAEKVRQGGFLGFFAREHFEVAVEIPDAVEVPDPATTQVERPVERPVEQRPTADDPSGTDRPARGLEVRGLDRNGAALDPDEAAVEALVRSLSDDRMPEPGRLAAEGLLGLADRVSAAERAAAAAGSDDGDGAAPGGWWSSMATPAHGIARVTTALGGVDRVPGPWDVPAADPQDEVASDPQDEVASDPRTAPTDVEAERRRAQDQAAAEAVIRAAVESRRAAPHEAPAAAAQPSTTRPEFTTLLDTLRSDVRPSPRPPTDPWTTPVPTGALLPPAQRTPVPVRVSVDEQPARPAVDEQPAAERDAEQHLEILEDDTATDTATAGDTASDTASDTETDHETDQTGDLRVAADRRTLRRLGVPAAWTRRYRGGDRFAGVMRMLDRLPELDVDPDTRIVAVVGPAAAVTMEAHRTALDLAIEDRPRAVVVVPSRQGQARRAAVARAQRLTAGVVAIATDDYDGVDDVLDTLQAVGAGAVVAVVEAHRGVEAAQTWLEALENVDAIVVD